MSPILEPFCKLLESSTFMLIWTNAFLVLISSFFLGFFVSSKGVHVDEYKINAIKTWPQPTNLQQVRSFLGLASFYRRFCAGF